MRRKAEAEDIPHRLSPDSLVPVPTSSWGLLTLPTASRSEVKMMLSSVNGGVPFSDWTITNERRKKKRGNSYELGVTAQHQLDGWSVVSPVTTIRWLTHVNGGAHKGNTVEYTSTCAIALTVAWIYWWEMGELPKEKLHHVLVNGLKNQTSFFFFYEHRCSGFHQRINWNGPEQEHKHAIKSSFCLCSRPQLCGRGLCCSSCFSSF